jgi:hypothetical protein
LNSQLLLQYPKMLPLMVNSFQPEALNATVGVITVNFCFHTI